MVKCEDYFFIGQDLVFIILWKKPLKKRWINIPPFSKQALRHWRQKQRYGHFHPLMSIFWREWFVVIIVVILDVLRWTPNLDRSVDNDDSWWLRRLWFLVLIWGEGGSEWRSWSLLFYFLRKHTVYRQFYLLLFC